MDYASCIVGTAWMPNYEGKLIVYSRAKLYSALQKDGLSEDEVDDWIEYNLSYQEGFVLLED